MCALIDLPVWRKSEYISPLVYQHPFQRTSVDDFNYSVSAIHIEVTKVLTGETSFDEHTTAYLISPQGFISMVSHFKQNFIF